MNREEGRNPEDHPYLKCYFSLECSRCDPTQYEKKVAVIAEMDTKPKAKNNEEQQLRKSSQKKQWAHVLPCSGKLKSAK